ncbi:serine hydrolase [Ornithinibacillus sp. L9]|uniref:Serine hydrolase n=1 Tax=Ornithinibacillus caprae TaxID=2678566 RepID=A0A6N8FKM1_9BACI|nr:serine hydrolase domain-containing protein [Ornithinibacillus caprae]MUK90200.1 serine hydrolase [Ornithinibacillus caprae]
MDWTIFEERMKKRMQKEKIPGAAIAISRQGKVIYEKGFGVRDIQTKEPVTPNTVFGIASVTKSFSALVIAKLEEEGKLSIDDPVVKHLPAFDIQHVEPIESVKIHHLLTHTTGLAPMQRREELNHFQDHLTYIASEEHDLLGKPGEYFSYCNDSFLLLGAIIEKYTGKLYRRALTEHVLNPLNMNRSTFNIEELHKMSNVSIPYIYDSQKEEFQEQPWPTLGNYEVGGGIRSTVKDLVKYGELYVNKVHGKLHLTSDQLAKMYALHVPIDQDSYYGYAFKVTPNYHGVTLVEHGGGQPGVSSNFGFIPEQKIVVAVLTNVSNVAANEIWLEAVNAMMELPLDEKLGNREFIHLPLGRKERFIGEYQSREGNLIEVKLENGDLYVIIEKEKYVLKPAKQDTLIIIKKNRPIRFHFKEGQDKAWAAFLGMRMLPRKK